MRYLIITFFCLISASCLGQNTAAFFNSFPSYYRCGDVTVSGTQLTVEALIKKTGTGPLLSSESSPDIVSKHQFPSDANYILRMEHAEITTTNGFFYTPVTPAIQSSFSKDSFYHVAMTYDGAALKFFVNGCLFSQVPVTGNMANNSFQTTIAQMAGNPTGFSTEQWFGYIDEVRIWNVVRTQSQIQANMKDLPSPTTQAGLLAYYKFEGNSVNVQGNAAFNAVPFGTPSLQSQNGWNSVKVFNATYSVQNAFCTNNGSITVYPEGGKSPYRFSKDGVTFQSSGTFSNLAPGSYTISARSDNDGCTKDTTIIVSFSCVSAGFTAPDTVCVNTPVTINNTSTGGTTFNWSFCAPDFMAAPTSTSLGNFGGALGSPVSIDYALYNGNYYGFVMSYIPAKLIRLDFGNSLLNTPVAVDLGNFGGVLPMGGSNEGGEGVQVVFNEGKWYAIIVAGWTPTGKPERIVKVEFGAALNNPAPVATNWGNIGNLSRPIDLHLFKEGSNWYGFTTNAASNTITRFNFTSSFDNIPTGVNLGNVGGLSYPTNMQVINDNGTWRLFVTNGVNENRSNTGWLSRLDFGNSLLNTPTGVNLGNFGGALRWPEDLTFVRKCGVITAIGINAEQGNSGLFRLDFNNGTGQPPVATNLGNVSGWNFPHSFSRLFTIGNDVYSFVPDANTGALNRVRWAGCTAASPITSTLQNPTPVTYSTPGTYIISLVVDQGTPTESSFCKQIVVLPPVTQLPTANLSVCAGDSVKIGRRINGAQYSWSTGATTDSIFVKTAGTYWIDINRYGCITRDSFILTIRPLPVLALTKSNDVNCSRPMTTLSATGANTYTWAPASLIVSSTGSTVIAKPSDDTWFTVTATGANGCIKKDSIKVLAKLKGAEDFHVANAFTPNGDGLNDCFGVRYWSGVSDFRFAIFDRWGVEVFKTTNAMECWDGTYKGKRQGSNRFVYYIKTNTACGPVFKKGTIVLIR